MTRLIPAWAISQFALRTSRWGAWVAAQLSLKLKPLGFIIMPTVLRRDGFVVLVLLPPREHGPPHVHIIKAGTEIIITLRPVAVRAVMGMPATDVVRAIRLVEDSLDFLVAEWKKSHG